MLIADFGLSKILSSQTNYFKSRVGNFVFMAPEIINEFNDRFTKAADMYSLGVLIFYIWTGNFEHNFKNLSYYVEGDKDIVIDGAPKEISDLITKLLQKEPSQRISIIEAHNLINNSLNGTSQDEIKQEYVENKKIYFGNGEQYGLYTGTLKNGLRDGKGVFETNIGIKYDGDWLNGAITGHGTYFWRNGSKYVGDFLDGNKHGFGLFTKSDGSMYEAILFHSIITMREVEVCLQIQYNQIKALFVTRHQFEITLSQLQNIIQVSLNVFLSGCITAPFISVPTHSTPAMQILPSQGNIIHLPLRIVFERQSTDGNMFSYKSKQPIHSEIITSIFGTSSTSTSSVRFLINVIFSLHSFSLINYSAKEESNIIAQISQNGFGDLCGRINSLKFKIQYQLWKWQQQACGGDERRMATNMGNMVQHKRFNIIN